MPKRQSTSAANVSTADGHTPPATPPSNSLHPTTVGEWRAWLKANHRRTEGVWLITSKKETGLPRVEYDDAVARALCFGWIDSKPAKLDAARSMLWFAPRQADSNWSKPNKERAERMIALGQMTAAGLKKIELAKQNSQWTALDAVENLEIPPDLAAALATYTAAAGHFHAFPRSAKRGILEWILNAKKPETRAKRIEETARLANENLRANQWRK